MNLIDKDLLDHGVEYTRYRCLTDLFYLSKAILGYEDMIEEVENHTPFYVSFEDNLYSSTVYGYLVGDNTFTRNKNKT